MLKRWRERRGLSMGECARRAGVDRRQWVNAEAGEGLTWKTVYRIVRFCEEYDRANPPPRRAGRTVGYEDFAQNAA